MSHKYSKGDEVFYTMPPGTIACWGVIDGLLYNHNNEPTYVINDGEVPETQAKMKLPAQPDAVPTVNPKFNAGDTVVIKETGEYVTLDKVEWGTGWGWMCYFWDREEQRQGWMPERKLELAPSKPAPRFRVGEWVSGDNLSVPRPGRVKAMRYVSEYSPGWRYQVDSDVDNYWWYEHALTPTPQPEASKPALTYADGSVVCRDDIVSYKHPDEDEMTMHVLFVDPRNELRNRIAGAMVHNNAYFMLDWINPAYCTLIHRANETSTPEAS